MPFVEPVEVYFADIAKSAAIGSRTISVVLDHQYMVGLGVVEGSNPIALCKDADVVGVLHGDSITIDSIVYTVREVQPDGSGMTLLQLRKV